MTKHQQVKTMDLLLFNIYLPLSEAELWKKASCFFSQLFLCKLFDSKSVT